MNHEIFMQRALYLAERGLGHVSPNPMVGAVLVYQNSIIGEGYHQKYGEAHAEVHAIRQAALNHPDKIAMSTLYVTLEPCCHVGKTPPCADLIIAQGIKKVYVAVTDPNPLVSGKGIEKLKQAGVDVNVGLCKAQATWLNKRFLTFMNLKRPYIVLKWAETNDGFLAKTTKERTQISNSESQTLVHLWRSQEDAFAVGANTVKIDNPKLTTRNIQGKNPNRVVFAGSQILPETAHIFNKDAKTIVITKRTDALYPQWVDTWHSDNPYHDLHDILNKLYQNKIQSIVVEGGLSLLQTFIKRNLWDEARVCKNLSLRWKTGLNAPTFKGLCVESKYVGSDRWYTYVSSENSFYLM